jgi:hypothetical protein
MNDHGLIIRKIKESDLDSALITKVNTDAGVQLGETSLTAYRGDRGKIAYDHSQVAHAPSTAQANQTVTAGVGMNFTATSGNVTITMGAPSTLTTVTTNSASGTTHAHAVTFPVTSVASKTGAVTLSATDVGLENVTNESKVTMFSSPTFTGTPLSTTAAQTIDNTQIATTAFVKLNFLTAGSTATAGALRYNGTTALAGQFDGGTTTPTGTLRLNYGGYFYPTLLNLVGSADTSTAATHYFVETGTDGFVRPKTIANVRTEIVTKAAVSGAIAKDTATITTGSWVAGSYDGYGFRATIANAAVLVDDMVLVSFTLGTRQVAETAEITHAECYAGGVYLYSKTLPSTSVSIRYRVF